MRLLVSFILICIAFTAPLAVEANDTHIYRQDAAAKHLPATSFVTKIAKQDLVATIKSGYQVTAGAARAKVFSAGNFINTVVVGDSGVVSLNKKYFIARYTEHQPLALKLLFPKHYFW